MPSVPNSGSAAPPPPVWDAQPVGPPTGYGGFWIRVVAYIIDVVLLNIAFGILGAILGISIVPADFSKVDPAVLMSAVGRFQLMSLILTWLYFALLESSARGATIGKMAVGLRVVDEQGQQIGRAHV